MRCANCDAVMLEGGRYCGSCGVPFLSTSVAWLFRRAIGAAVLAAVAGGIAGWISAPLWGLGLLSGAFLGACPAVMERQARDLARGLFAGGAGGLLGAVAAGLFRRMDLAVRIQGEAGPAAAALEEVLLQTAVWLSIGVALGLAEALRASRGHRPSAPGARLRRMLAFAVSGILGGSVAGSITFGTLAPAWDLFGAPGPAAMRMVQAGLAGAILWLFLGLAERFSPEGTPPEEVRALCKRCGAENRPSDRYCISCGTHLRVGLRRPARRFGALRRISSGYRFFGYLVVLLGPIAALWLFGALLFRSVLLAFVAAIGVAVASYVVFLTFHAVSEMVSVFLEIEENTRRWR